MARFILDVMTKDIKEVLHLIERDSFISSKIASIRCIDNTNNNQFNSSSIKNVLSKEQLETDKQILKEL